MGSDYSEFLTWGLIAAGAAFLAARTRLPVGPAVAIAALAGLVTKTVLLELV